MEDLIEHWSRLQYQIQAVETANVRNLGERVSAMEQERLTFNKLFTAFALKNYKE